MQPCTACNGGIFLHGHHLAHNLQTKLAKIIMYGIVTEKQQFTAAVTVVFTHHAINAWAFYAGLNGANAAMRKVFIGHRYYTV